MRKTKLIRLLSVLEPEEFKQFPKFIKSPFFNSNKHFFTLYNYLKKYYPEFNSPKLDRNLVFDKIFPGKKFHYNIFNNLVSGFTRLTESYLANLQFQKEDFERKKMLLKAFEKRKTSYDFFEKQIDLLFGELETSPYRNIDFFKERFWMSKLRFNHPGIDKYRLNEDDYGKALNDLDNYFILEKLLLISELKARESFLSEKYDIWLLEEIKNKKSDIPLHMAYLDIIHLLETGEEAAYFKLKSTFENHFKLFNNKEQQDILQILINHTIKEGNSGNTVFINENFELYKIGLKQDLFLVNGQLNDTIYLNIVGIAMKVGAFDWCFDFLDDYESKLDIKVRADAKSFGQGIWYYYQGKIKEAIDFFYNFDFVNDFYQLRGRSLLLRIYFEQFLKDISYFDLLITQCHSFEKYIRRNTFLATEKEKAYLDFILLLKQISRAVMDLKIKPALKSRWLKKIDEKEYLYGKSWLKEQIEMLK